VTNLLLTVLVLLPATSGAQTVAPDRPALPLSLKQAVDLALAPEGNARVQLTDELVRQAQARAGQSRAALLPNLDAALVQQNRTLNLAANGIRINVPAPGFTFPKSVGPFNTFDARATLSQSVLDFSAIRRFQAARVGVRAAELDTDSARDQVAA